MRYRSRRKLIPSSGKLGLTDFGIDPISQTPEVSAAEFKVAALQRVSVSRTRIRVNVRHWSFPSHFGSSDAEMHDKCVDRGAVRSAVEQLELVDRTRGFGWLVIGLKDFGDRNLLNTETDTTCRQVYSEASLVLIGGLSDARRWCLPWRAAIGSRRRELLLKS